QDSIIPKLVAGDAIQPCTRVSNPVIAYISGTTGSFVSESTGGHVTVVAVTLGAVFHLVLLSQVLVTFCSTTTGEAGWPLARRLNIVSFALVTVASKGRFVTSNRIRRFIFSVLPVSSQWRTSRRSIPPKVSSQN